MNDRLLRTLICLAASLLLALLVPSLRADEAPADKKEKQAPKDKAPAAQKDSDDQQDKKETDDGEKKEEADEDERPRRRGRRMRYDRRNEKNHSSVLAAFHDVVRDARKSTVAVLVDGEQRALGAIVDSGGYILTKFSEIEDAPLKCRLYDGRRLPAELIDSDVSTDLAMLKVEADNLVPLVWAEDSQPTVGHWLATTSYDSLPAAVGVVSVVPRKIDRPGGLLGVVLEDGDDGPLVVRVLAGSAAEKSRVFVNDVIKQLNGKAIRNRQMLINMLRRMKAGADVKLTIARADEETRDRGHARRAR